MRSNWRLLIPAVLLSLAAGCSVDTVDDTDVNEEKLYGKYQVHYYEGDRNLQFYAQLRLGGSTGTTIRLSEGTMQVDGQSMRLVDGDQNPINLAGSYYVLLTSSDDPGASHTFTWTRSDGSAFENTITTVPAFTVTAPTAGSSHGAGDIKVTLDGPALRAGEHYQVTLTAENDAGEGQDGLLVERTEAGNEVIFPADDVSRLPAGAVSVRVRRSQSTRPQAGHDVEGGELISSRVAAEFDIVVGSGE